MIKIFDYAKKRGGKKGERKEYETGVRKGNLNSNVSIIKTKKEEDWKLRNEKNMLGKFKPKET